MALTEIPRSLSLPAYLRNSLPMLLGFGLFVMGLWALHHLLATIDVRQVIAQIRANPWPALATALAATATGYAALVDYDFWALDYLGGRLLLHTVALGGILGYAFGNTMGISVISGGAVCYRVYSAAGLSALEGAALSSFFALANRALREGLAFELIPPPHSATLLLELKAVSDSWFAGQRGTEKSFSVGAFDPSYLDHCEIALVRNGDRIVAFANLLGIEICRWIGVDLMRYRPESRGVMQFLFLALIERLQTRGVEEFSLGLVALSGLPDRPSATRISRLGNLVFRHGGAFYNFEGLRRFKQKFRPEWRPRYAALPPGVSPYFAMAEIAVLISGGAGNLIAKD